MFLPGEELSSLVAIIVSNKNQGVGRSANINKLTQFCQLFLVRICESCSFDHQEDILFFVVKNIFPGQCVISDN